LDCIGLAAKLLYIHNCSFGCQAARRPALARKEPSIIERSDISPTIFYIQNRRLILTLFLPIAVICLSRIVSNLLSEEPWLNWLAGLVMWLFLSVHALRRRLVLDQNGLAYTDFFTTIHIPWEQVTRLDSRTTLGIWRVEGMVVRVQTPKPKDLFIDLSQFSKAWRQDTLGSILQKKLPNLFQ
jgi:hypothetical protein